MDIEKLLAALTMEEKLRLCMGLDFWSTYPVKRLGIPSVRTSDGPHGLRKQEKTDGDISLDDSVPATCFPPASLSSASFDRSLIKRMAGAIAEEAVMMDIDVVLGPAVNIKRSPLCGRNFEYVSEDPCAAGEFAAAYIEGMQSRGVGTSLKHFALNNQETFRLTINSVADERTIREIYLPAFETAVRRAQPWTVMASYNRINGLYGCENGHTIKELLRGDWGFKGLVVSDWGAVRDRAATLGAGCDLEMPGTGEARLHELRAQLSSGEAKEADIDEAVRHVLGLVERKMEAEPAKAAIRKQTASEEGRKALYKAHDSLALEIAEKSMVLLKNDENTLPLSKDSQLAVIGRFANEPRYQGGGSSHIVPTALRSFINALDASGSNSYVYCEGYSLKDDGPDKMAISQAAAAAAHAGTAVIFAGLTDFDEFEGCDRRDMALPEGQTALIRAVTAACRNTIVVLCAGSAVEMPWIDGCKAVLYAGVSGQAGGEAVRRILFGEVNPSGHLTETFPVSFSNLASRGSFPGGSNSVYYKEGLYVGYRYYASAGIPVRFPFGWGLSYTSFSLSAPWLATDAGGTVLGEGQSLEIEVEAANTGSRAGACVVQIYVKNGSSNAFNPVYALKDFARVDLEPGAKTALRFTLPYRAFERYDSRDGWVADSAEYEIFAAQNAADPGKGLKVAVSGKGRAIDKTGLDPYFKPEPGAFAGPGSDAAFVKLLGREPEALNAKWRDITLNTPLCYCRKTCVGRLLAVAARKSIISANKKLGAAATTKALLAQVQETPIRSMLTMNGGTNLDTGKALVLMMNHHYIKGLRLLRLSIKEERETSQPDA